MKSMRSIHSLIRCCMILLLLTSCYSKEERRGLVIHSYEKDYQGYAEFNKLIKKEFAKAHIPVKLTFFYLNCEINNEQQEIDKINNLLDSIAGWESELLLVNDDQATYSLLKTHHPLLKGIPIVFSGVNYPNWELIGQYNNVTGFHDKIDFRKNLEMVHRLTGKNHIYTILDFTFLDRKVRNDIDNQLKSTDIISNLDWHLGKNDTRKEAEKGHIIINALSARNLSKNQNKDQTKGGDFIWSISKYSTLPYLQTKFDYTTVTMASLSTRQRFTTINELFDCGRDFLGGYITPMHIQVEESVHAAARILNGENVADIPIQESAKGYFIDWNAMQKEHLTIADIPHEYTIINIPFKTRHPIVWWFALLGSITAIVGLLSGITYLYWRETKRKRSILYELEDEKESLALAVEGSDTYAWRLKDDTMVFEYAFWKNLGMAPHPLTIDGFLSFVDADYLDTTQALLTKNATNGKHFIKLKCDFNGTGYQWWELRCSTMKSALGGQKTTGLLLNIEDYKKREQELIEARKMAEKAELKESFLANISHEIRTPLNAIVGFSTLLASPDDTDITPEEKEQYIDTINRNSELLLKLINDILELSRIESGYMSFDCDDYPLDALIRDTYQTHKILIPGQLHFLLEEGEKGLIVHVDKNRLVQVITNFLNNASKFTREGSIKLGWSYMPQTEEVEIYVEDTGIGIPQSEQKMIFGRFYKQNEFAQGTGLGLSICKLIIEKLQGRLSLRSEAGTGSRFSIFFSCKKQSI